MATPVEKAKCVLWLESTQSVSTVQRRYQAQYGKTPPSRACVYAWYKRFSETGCLCPKSRPGSVSDEVAERVKSAFANAPDMSTRRASKELGVPPATINKIMRSHTHKEPRIRRYRYQVGSPQDEDALKRLLFIKEIPAPIDAWLENVVFSGAMNYFLTGEVSRKDLIVFGSDKSQDVTEPDESEAALKLTVLCAMSKTKVYGPFFVSEDVPNDGFYLRIFEESLVPQLERDGISDNIVLQVDVPQCDFGEGLRHLLETRLSERWVGPVSDSLPQWPQRSPELSPVDFFLWGFVHDHVYDEGPVSSVAELRHRIARALSSVPETLLQQAWDKLNAQYEACRRNRGHRPE